MSFARILWCNFNYDTYIMLIINRAANESKLEDIISNGSNYSVCKPYQSHNVKIKINAIPKSLSLFHLNYVITGELQGNFLRDISTA